MTNFESGPSIWGRSVEVELKINAKYPEIVKELRAVLEKYKTEDRSINR